MCTDMRVVEDSIIALVMTLLNIKCIGQSRIITLSTNKMELFNLVNVICNLVHAIYQ